MLVELGLGLTESIIFYLNEQLAELYGDGILDNIIGSFVTISCGSGSWLSLNPLDTVDLDMCGWCWLREKS